MKNKKLTWEELADFYHKKTGGQARIRPLNDIFNWATQQPEIVKNDDGSLFMQPINTVEKPNELYQDLPITVTSIVIDRVRQLMGEVGLDSGNVQLVLDIAVIYVQAQRDQIKSQLEGDKQ